jgi:hypothetical protein
LRPITGAALSAAGRSRVEEFLWRLGDSGGPQGGEQTRVIGKLEAHFIHSLPWLEARGALSPSEGSMGEGFGPPRYHILIIIRRQQSF